MTHAAPSYPDPGGNIWIGHLSCHAVAAGNRVDVRVSGDTDDPILRSRYGLAPASRAVEIQIIWEEASSISYRVPMVFLWAEMHRKDSRAAEV